MARQRCLGVLRDREGGGAGSPSHLQSAEEPCRRAGRGDESVTDPRPEPAVSTAWYRLTTRFINVQQFTVYHGMIKMSLSISMLRLEVITP